MLPRRLTTKYPALNRVVLNKWFWVVIVLLLGGLAWHFLHKNPAGDASGFAGRGGRNITSVGVATAEKTDMPIILNALGTVTATAMVTVHPQISGVLRQVNFQEGQMVKAGQLLATIDPRPFELALMQASGQRQRDEAQLHNAQLVLKRDLALQEQDSISQQDVEAQAALVKQLEGTLMSDRAQEGTAQLNLSYTKVVAPVSGRVGLRTVDVGNLVGAGDTAGIAVIAQLTPIDVEFAVPQNQVADVQNTLIDQGESAIQTKPTPLKVTVLDRNRADIVAEGEFLALDNQVDVQTGTVRAKARFANDHQTLFPNEFVNVKVFLRSIKEAVVIPISALRHGTKGDFVYVLDSDSSTVTQRTVTTGQVDVDRVQVTNGLQPGEKVITEGADKLKDGAKVNLPSNAPVEATSDAKPGSEVKPGKEARSGREKNWKNKDWQNKDGQNKDSKQDDAHKNPEGSDSGAESSPPSGEHRHRRKADEQ